MRIAVDAMGGDFAPRNVVEGAVAAAEALQVGVILVGPVDRLRAEAAAFPQSSRIDLQLVDAPDVVAMGEPSTALRRKPAASIAVAADLVARGEAQAVVSAGNTGAAVLAARAAFGMLPGVDRPALATIIPTLEGRSVLLDSGANLECRPAHLVQFAALGSLYAQIALDTAAPRIGLLSIGVEETKGSELVRDAHRLLKKSRPDFIGNIEARDLFAGQADVVVCDGVTGNIALKVGEGLVDAVEELLRRELKRDEASRMGLGLAMKAFGGFRSRIDYAEYGGAPLLGVARLCIIAHGRSSARAIQNAVTMAHRLANEGLIERLGREMPIPVT